MVDIVDIDSGPEPIFRPRNRDGIAELGRIPLAGLVPAEPDKAAAGFGRLGEFADGGDAVLPAQRAEVLSLQGGIDRMGDIDRPRIDIIISGTITFEKDIMNRFPQKFHSVGFWRDRSELL